MTLQQLEYIVALDQHRHFIRAAEACGVTQSTLSMMVKKLEEELDTTIFYREAHPIRPTEAGEKIIAQARVILFNTRQLKELSLSEREQSSGNIKIAAIPTIAPYIIPKLFRVLKEKAPGIKPQVFEINTAEVTEKLNRAEIDMAIMATPINHPNLLEIPLYYERLVFYISSNDPLYSKEDLNIEELPTERLWMLKEGHCLRNQVINLCDKRPLRNALFEAGSIDTLINIVDENGGFTVIPELHIALLDEGRRKNVRSLINPEPVREISLVIRKDYVRERILNEIANAIKEIIPSHMIDARLKRYAIRL